MRLGAEGLLVAGQGQLVRLAVAPVRRRHQLIAGQNRRFHIPALITESSQRNVGHARQQLLPLFDEFLLPAPDDPS